MKLLDSSKPACQPPQNFINFFVSRVREEMCGRPVPGVPIKIMGADPRTIGEQVAKLVRSRYREIRIDSIETMPRTRLITIQLRTSYLVISLEFPEIERGGRRKSVVFRRFVDSFEEELSRKDSASFIQNNGAKKPFWHQ